MWSRCNAFSHCGWRSIKKQKDKAPGTVAGNPENRHNSTEHLPDRPMSPQNASNLDAVAVQSDTTSQVSKKSPTILAGKEYNVKTSTNDQENVILLNKRNHRVRFTVRIDYFSLNPVVSTFDSRASPKEVDQVFLHQSWRKFIWPVNDQHSKSALSRAIFI